MEVKVGVVVVEGGSEDMEDSTVWEWPLEARNRYNPQLNSFIKTVFVSKL